jgi:4-hydroxybutyryl-CoA dehydratase/vinylacetyl-CoA-Delta-isomerase
MRTYLVGGFRLLRTPEQYRESLKRMRPNIYKFGKLIEDVTTHPCTKRTVEGHAQIFSVQNDPKYQDLVTKKSTLTGEMVSRYLSLIEGPEDMIANCRMKRLMYHLTGTCTGGRCVGYASLNALWPATYDADKEGGTDHHQRLKDWLKGAQTADITLAGALTDPKGDRTLPPNKQPDPDMNLHVVDRDDEGITVRGAKAMICGVAASNEIFILPGSVYREEDKDYSVSFAMPRDIEGLTIVEARHPSDRRDEEEGFDNPVTCGGITQAYLFFDDVKVPRERVFLDGQYKQTLTVITTFTSAYRAAIGSCVAGQGDVMIGAAMLVAQANGLDEKPFRERLIKMTMNNEITYGMGISAGVLGHRHPSGAWICDQLLSNVNKMLVGKLPYETKALAQDIAGGIGETGCMPSSIDLNDEKHGHLVKKYLKAHSDAETRMRAARLVEWLTLGCGVPGCMHGGGSPEGAKLFVRVNMDLEKKIEMARRLAGIEEPIVPKEKRAKK